MAKWNNAGELALGHLGLWEEGPLALSEEEAARRIRRSLFFLGLHCELCLEPAYSPDFFERLPILNLARRVVANCSTV